MQLKSTIIDNFSRKGYFQPTLITKREFHILMNTLLSQSNSHPHWLFDQNLTNEIWKQAEQRIGKPQTQIKVQTITSTIVDAIQILTNRIIECQELIQELKQKRQSYEYDQNFMKLQPLQKRMQTLKKDTEQFEKDFKMLTEPFMGENAKGELKRHSIKRKQTVKENASSNDEPRQVQKPKPQLLDDVIKHHFEQHKTQRQKEKRTSNSKEQKNCSFYLLVFLCSLQVTVCMIKYDFMNLIVYLLGFMVLSQQKFLPHMIKIAFWATFLSVLIDVAWLLTYMKSYLHLFLGVSIKRELKPYYQYVWFVTLLQCVLKLLLLYFIKSYEMNFVNEQKEKDYHQDNQHGQQVIKDAYIPKVREMTKDFVQTTNKP